MTDTSRWLRPHWIQIVGVLVPIAILVGASFSVWIARPSAGSLFVFAIIALVGIYAGVRWAALSGVRLVNQSILITRLLWSRKVPLERVSKVTKGYVAIHWRTASGKSIVSPVTALWSKPRPVQIITDYSNAAVDVIRAWTNQRPR